MTRAISGKKVPLMCNVRLSRLFFTFFIVTFIKFIQNEGDIK